MDSLELACAELTDRIRTAAAHRTPLRLRGGGSKDFYGGPLLGEVLDTTVLRGVVAYEPSELVVTVGAGTPLVELEAMLAEHGQCLPFEPPHLAWSGAAAATTVGGMVASGLSGPARASVGGVRDYVLGLRMVNGRGEGLTFGGQVMKNVAGYDVSRLMVGAMGTLGLITEVSLKVLPVAPAEATLCFALPQHAALEQLHRWGGQPLPLNASCWVHDRNADTATMGGPGMLRVRLRGAVAAVEAACRTMLAEQPGQRMDAAQSQADWQSCRNQQLSFFTHPAGADGDGGGEGDEDLVLWRLSVAQTAPVLDLPSSPLVEWHGGLRWLWAAPDAGPALQAQAAAHGGSAMFFVAGRGRSMRVPASFGIRNPASLAIQQRLKDSFDPMGIFNPGV